MKPSEAYLKCKQDILRMVDHLIDLNQEDHARGGLDLSDVIAELEYLRSSIRNNILADTKALDEEPE